MTYGSIRTQRSDNQSLVLSYRLMRVPCYYSFFVFTCKKRACQEKCQKGRLPLFDFGRKTVNLRAGRGVGVRPGGRGRSGRGARSGSGAGDWRSGWGSFGVGLGGRHGFGQVGGMGSGGWVRREESGGRSQAGKVRRRASLEGGIVRRRLKGGVLEKTLILQLPDGFTDGLTGAEDLQMPAMMKVGAQEVDISLFDEI